MSGKSIFLSLLSLVLYVAFIFAIVFLFKIQFILGFVGIALFLIPFKVQRKAIDEASGKLDEIFAKYIIPVFLLIAILFIVLYLTNII